MVLTIGLLLAVTFGKSTNYTSAKSGYWNDPVTWGGAGVPVAGDIVVMDNSAVVTVTADAECASITFTNSKPNSLSIGSKILLKVSGSITIGGAQTGHGINSLDVGDGYLAAGNIIFDNGGHGHQITISTGTVTVTGNVSGPNNETECVITFSGAGLLKLGGSIFNSANNTLTTFPGSTVEYNATVPQTVGNFIYSNLKLSNIGVKSITTGTSISDNLSISGTTATASVGSGLNISVGSLTLGGINKNIGTWGSTTSSATYKNNSYFASTTGIVTVSKDTRPIPSFGGLTASPSICYGNTTVVLSGSVSAAGPVYPVGGEKVGVTINGVTQNATISGDVGGFSINFNVPTNLASGNYAITYSYTGTDSGNLKGASNNTGTALTVNPTVGIPGTPTPTATTICQGSGSTTYTTSATSAITYNWTVSGAGNTISGTGTTGTVIWAAGYSGTATVSVTANGCNGPSTSASTTITVLPTPTASIIGPVSVCQNLAGQNITFINPQDLVVNITYNINGTNQTPITVGARASATLAIPTGTAATYIYNLVTVIYQTGPVCSNPITGSVTVIVNATVGTPVFTLGTPTTRCQGAGTVTYSATATNTTGITYSLDAASITGGNSIVATTGAVTYATGWSGTSTITAIAAGCNGPIKAIYTVTTPSLPVATFSYVGTQYCSNAANPSPTYSGGGVAGTFSSTVGLVFVSNVTGQVNLGASTAGSYIVTNTITASGNCGNVKATSSITIIPLPVATFTYTLTPSPVFSGGGVAGTFSSTPGLVFVDNSTGVVNLASTPGTYIVTNTVIAAGGCGIDIAKSSITISTSHSVAYVWGGSISTDWNVPNNWLTGIVPGLTSDAIIPDANTTLYDPVLPSSPAASASVKTISLQVGGILNGGTAPTLTIAGSISAWQNLGTFNAGASTVSFTGTNATISNTTNFYNVSIATGAVLTPESGNVMRIAGAITLVGTGVLNAALPINTIEYNGTNQTLINPNGLTKGYYNLILSGSGIKTLPATSNLTVLGTLTNNVGAVGFVLQSNVLGTASLIHSTDGVPATVERYISGAKEDWHFLSSPVAAQNFDNIWLPSGTYANGTGYDLYLWYETKNCWIYKLNIDPLINWLTLNTQSYFVPGRGYLYSLLVPNQTKVFKGNLNNGDQSFSITSKPLVADPEVNKYKGFNLVGNPYPSAIDWKASGWLRNNLEIVETGNFMWIWNPNPAIAGYGVYNTADLDDVGTNSVTRYIPSMQGFFVKALTDGVLSMKNSVRVHKATSTWKSTKQAVVNIGKVSLIVKSDAGIGSDEIQLRFGYSETGNGAMKMFSRVASSPNLYMVSKGNELSVMYLTNTKENPAVPVKFVPGVTGNYTFDCNFDQSNFETVMLEDRQMHTIQNMKITKTYRFTASKTDDLNRFVLYFGPVNSPTGYELPARIYNDGIHLVVDLILIAKETNVIVYDIMGRIILQQKMQGGILHNLNINTRTQMLVVNLKNSDGSLSRKLIWVR